MLKTSPERLAYIAQWRRDNPEKVATGHAQYRKKHRTRLAANQVGWKHAHRKRHMLIRAKHRAKKLGLDFDLTPEDVVFIETCPVFGIRLNYMNEKRADDSPSLDRVNNQKGYVKGNVRVISFRANRLKQAMTAEELERLLRYARGEL